MRIAATSTALAVMLSLGCGDSSSGPPTLSSIEIVFPAAATPTMVHDTVQLALAGKDQCRMRDHAGKRLDVDHRFYRAGAREHNYEQWGRGGVRSVTW